MITLRDQVEWEDYATVGPPGVIHALREKSERAWQELAGRLAAAQQAGLADRVQKLWIVNAVALDASLELMEEIKTWPEVLGVEPVRSFTAPSLTPTEPIPARVDTAQDDSLLAANLRQVRAPDLWDLGFRGSGIVVANMDTGVDGSHPDLALSWRGGSNSWYDPHGEHPDVPVDINGHGTAVMGIMAAGDASGQALGLAPEARWIAVKIFNDRGSTTSDVIHSGFQWLLDPDGNPGTVDAPQVVVLSWTSLGVGCDLEFQPDLQALRAAGILPVFAAGNFGPAPATSRSPANNPEAYAVGALTGTDEVLATSSRGPSACNGDTAYPDLTAPGESILTTTRGDGYASFSGTSMAAPHVAAGLALLLDAFPRLSAADQAAALQAGARDLGAPGVDNDSGYGRLDLFTSYRWLTLRQPPVPVVTHRLFIPGLILH